MFRNSVLRQGHGHLGGVERASKTGAVRSSPALPVRDVDMRLNIDDPRVVADVGRMLIVETPTVGALGLVVAWAGAARPRMATMNPIATTAANPDQFIVMLLLLSWLTGRSLASGIRTAHPESRW